MMSWWPQIGEASLWAGSGLGLIWALVSTTRRRHKFIKAATPPVGQFRWFLLSLLSMGCYLTLVTALGLASLNGLLPQALFWYLLGLSALAFTTALMFPVVEVQHPMMADRLAQEPPADPPLLPLRRSA